MSHTHFSYHNNDIRFCCYFLLLYAIIICMNISLLKFISMSHLFHRHLFHRHLFHRFHRHLFHRHLFHRHLSLLRCTSLLHLHSLHVSDVCMINLSLNRITEKNAKLATPLLTTTGSALDGAVFDITQILAYLIHNMSKSQLHLGFDSLLFSVNNILAGLWLNCISSVENYSLSSGWHVNAA